MKRLGILIAGLVALAALGACEPTPKDPGSCKTIGDFSYAEVDRSYVRMVCSDWVFLMLSNCIEVDALPLNPTETEVALYCEDKIDAWEGSHEGPGFEFAHSCNFIDNPSYECTQYVGASSPLLGAPLESRQAMSRAVSASPRLKANASRLDLYLEGFWLKASELDR